LPSLAWLCENKGYSYTMHAPAANACLQPKIYQVHATQIYIIKTLFHSSSIINQQGHASYTQRSLLHY